MTIFEDLEEIEKIENHALSFVLKSVDVLPGARMGAKHEDKTFRQVTLSKKFRKRKIR